VLETMRPNDAARVCAEIRWWADDVLAEPSVVPGDDDTKIAATTLVLKCLDAVLNADIHQDAASNSQQSTATHRAARM
jgi:hypothetical protein